MIYIAFYVCVCNRDIIKTHICYIQIKYLGIEFRTNSTLFFFYLVYIFTCESVNNRYLHLKEPFVTLRNIRMLLYLKKYTCQRILRRSLDMV